LRVFLSVIFLALLAYGLGFVLFVSNLPNRPDRIPKADGIVALTGGGERLDTAVSLLEHGVGKRLLVSGVSQPTKMPLVNSVCHWSMPVVAEISVGAVMPGRST